MPKPSPHYDVSEPRRSGSKLLVERTEAAAMLSMSLTSFEKYVQSDLALVRRGRMRLVPVKELERWVTSNADKIY